MLTVGQSNGPMASLVPLSVGLRIIMGTGNVGASLRPRGWMKYCMDLFLDWWTLALKHRVPGFPLRTRLRNGFRSLRKPRERRMRA